jgi:hypothetical protein
MSTVKSKTPTPQGISALLRKAGFTRATPGNGMFGYVASKIYAGECGVRVRYLGLRSAPDGARREQLEEYAKVISAAGYAAAIDGDGWELIVTAATEEA